MRFDREATGTAKPTLNQRLILQTIEALWMPTGLSKEETVARVQSAIELLQGIKPEDVIEGMLATQMVATHSAAMDCLRRAMISGQTYAGIEQNLKHAAKLMSLYVRQIDTLNKHRGKGQQKVTVEHVHVEAGGQAMVGHIETAANSASSPDRSKDTPKAITHAPGKTLDMSNRTKTPAKQRNE